jgi:hypothetical protein
VEIASLLLASILALMPCLPALAADTGTVTITMTGVDEISITLEPTAWPLGDVSPDTEYLTSPPIDWCTLTNTGNVSVNTFIVGEDARWYEHGTGKNYYWTLSDSNESDPEDATRGHKYMLWFRVHGDTDRGYVLITKEAAAFWPPEGGSSISAADSKQFGLKVLSPTFFYGGREMKTTITISAVAA